MSQFSDFIEGYNTVKNYQKLAKEEEDKRLATEIYNKHFNPQGVSAPRNVPASFIKNFFKQEEKGGYVSTAADTQPVNIPQSTLEAVDPAANVETAPLKQEAPVVEGFATSQVPSDNTRMDPTSPYKTFDEKGMESPADQPYGYGAIPKDAQAPANTEAIAPPQDTPMSPMPPAANTEAVKEKSFYSQTVENLTASQNKMNAHQEELSKIKSVASEMRSKGLFKEADNYESKSIEAQKNLYEATDAFYKNATTALDFKARLANTFLDDVKRGMPTDTAWNQAMLKAHWLGIPGMEEFANLQGEDRVKFAQSVVSDASSTKDRLKNDMDQKREQNKTERFTESQTRLKENDINVERNRVFERDLKTKKFDAAQVKQEFDRAHTKVKDLMALRDKKQATLDKLKKGDPIYDDFGMLLEGPERQREAAILNGEVNSYNQALTTAQDHLNNIKPFVSKADVKETEANIKKETAPTTSQLPTEVKDALASTLKANPGLRPQIKKQFEITYPNLKFEDYDPATASNTTEAPKATAKQEPVVTDKQTQIANIRKQIAQITRRLDPKAAEKADIESISKSNKEFSSNIGTNIKETFTGARRNRELVKQLNDLNDLLATLEKE